MFRGIFFIPILLLIQLAYGQSNFSISGSVTDKQDKTPIAGVLIIIEGESIEIETNDQGRFNIPTDLKGEFILKVSFQDYEERRLPILLEGKEIALGTIYLQRDISIEKQDNLITITDAEILDDEATSNSLGLLQATRDIFLSRAAFDFGQAFYRVRGYDAQNGEVLINGMLMNKMYDGRPQWNNWGGLNDITKNQQYTNGLESSNYTFGGILGNTNIDLRPSGLRPGTRVSSSVSNRTYTGRLMATYKSGINPKGLAYMVSASRRWAKEGFIDGTLYDAYSISGQLEYQISENNTLLVSGILASNRRGRSSALTEEIFELVGRKYNPYWGSQNGEIRNSRERKISEPLVMINYFHEGEKLNLSAGLSYQKGSHAKGRLGYYNAPNPDPSYYRYLPSFYINSPIGANFVSAEESRIRFEQAPQLKWQKIYDANLNQTLEGKAAYVLFDDVISDTQFSVNMNGDIKLSDKINLGFGITSRNLVSDNYAEINDLLGAEYHEDIDPFSNTLNDVSGELKKEEGETFNYNYKFEASELNSYTQLKLDLNKWKLFFAGQYTNNVYQRIGLFQNERFLDNSEGPGRSLKFSNFGIKGGLTYSITGRHWISLQGALVQRAPLLQNSFVNPRESDAVVAELLSEKISTVDFNYFMRMPNLTGRFTGFYTRFQDLTDVNYFFVDSGVGSDFVQEVLTGLDKLHMGTELGLEYQLTSAFKMSLVASVGKYIYASDPTVTINFDTTSSDGDLIDNRGFRELGPASIKDYKLSQGPQKAFAYGLEYRDPKYWWVGMTANYLANNYANIATITRTSSFYLNPETGEKFPGATQDNVDKLLLQEPMESFYLLNLVGGKSWLKKGKYISVFASINNVFDTTFKTGGYEQSRNGNFGQLQEDNLSGRPSFGTKYWYGYGRTYFLNLALSF